MKIIKLILLMTFIFHPAFAMQNKEKGEYLSILGDCAACHTVNQEKQYAGGLAFDMPMGKIISSNITPSKSHGIGNWTEEDFSKAVREGVRPNGTHLYPAMPYTSYRLISDEDMHDLYVYFMNSVKPVDENTEAKTQLDFPFNIPFAMSFWNALFLDNQSFEPDDKLSEQENRGKYLVEGLAHCSTCHTPRNQFLVENDESYLGGAVVNNWYAPNITSDKISGLGGWSDDDIFAYLKTGKALNKGQAGGPMGEAVENSFQYLKDEDIYSIISYLRTVPAIRDNNQAKASYSYSGQSIALEEYEEYPSHPSDSEEYRDISTLDGAILFNNNCAACHGINGEGSDDQFIPSLTHNTAVGDNNPTNLIMAMVEGIHRKSQFEETEIVMPAFSGNHQMIHSWLSDDQIASIANYVTEKFGAGNKGLTSENILKIKQGEEPPFLIKNAALFAWVFIFIIIMFSLWISRKIYKKCNKKR